MEWKKRKKYWHETVLCIQLSILKQIDKQLQLQLPPYTALHCTTLHYTYNYNSIRNANKLRYITVITLHYTNYIYIITLHYAIYTTTTATPATIATTTTTTTLHYTTLP